MDALASFVYLTDHLPSWTIKINNLAAHALTKREEFTAEYKGLLEHARPKRKKTPSTTSLHPNDKQASVRSLRDESNARDGLALPRRTEFSPLDPANKYLFANARRDKRKLGTSFRSGASGPQTFRNQHQVIIYYDSILQDAFEGLVKDIATARNNVRKGKQARALELGLRLPSLGVGDCGRRQRNAVLPNPPQSHAATELPREPKLLLNDPPLCGDAPFNDVAKNLEAAQALCETAAHQFLRDGDCTLEINQIRAYLENVLLVAKAQVVALEQERNAELSDIMDSKPAVDKEDHEMASVIAEKLGVSIMPVVTASAAEIEVDSEDNDEEEHVVIDISTFRAARMTGWRA